MITQTIPGNCRCCGEYDNRHHILPSGIVICPEEDNNYWHTYQKELRTLPVNDVVQKWKYFSNDIDHQYDQNTVYMILKSKLSYFTDEFIKDKEKQKYVNLLYPKMFVVIDCAQRGSWVGDPQQKTKGYCSTLFKLIQYGFVTIDEQGYIQVKTNKKD